MKFLKLIVVLSIVSTALFLLSGTGFSDEQAAPATPAPGQEQVQPAPLDDENSPAAPDSGMGQTPDEDNGGSQEDIQPAPDQTPDEDDGGGQLEPVPDEPQTL